MLSSCQSVVLPIWSPALRRILHCSCMAMAKTKNLIKQSGGSSSKSAFTRALSLVHSNKKNEQQMSRGAKGSQAKERSATRFEIAILNCSDFLICTATRYYCVMNMLCALFLPINPDKDTTNKCSLGASILNK